MPPPATAENREKLKAWIEQHHSPFACNQSPYQLLLLMSDLPPLQLLANPRAKPVRVHQPVSILYHWGKQVKAEYPCAQNPECPPAPVHETLSAPVHKTLSALNLEDHMETAILGVEKDQLSKRFRAGLRTQPDQADTVTITTLLDVVNRGIPDSRDIGTENTREYSKVRTELHNTYPVMLNGKRVVLPPPSRLRVRKCCRLPTRAPQG